jgi:hypothetical protein
VSLATLGLLASALAVPEQRRDLEPHFKTRNPKLHSTKPWESIEDARKRKKAERQRKKKARRKQK